MSKAELIRVIRTLKPKPEARGPRRKAPSRKRRKTTPPPPTSHKGEVGAPQPNSGRRHRPRIEAVLSDEQVRYRALVDMSPDAILVNQEDKVVLVNEAGLKLFGATEATQVLGRSPLEFFHPSCHAGIRRGIRRVLAGAGPAPLPEQKLMRLDGQIRAVEVVASICPQGSKPAIQVIVRDITEQKAAQAQLTLLSTCLSRLKDVVIITEAEPIDEPGPRIVFVNNAFQEHTGYTSEEAIGRSPRFLQGPLTSRTELDRIRDALRAWKPVRSELVNYTKSGQPFWVEIEITPVANESGWFINWVAVQRDITDRKNVEQALLESEQRYRSLVEASPDAIIVLNKSHIQFVNKAGLELLGASSPQQIIGRRLLEFFRSNRHETIQVRLSDLNQRMGASPLIEEELVRTDGSIRWVAVASAMFEADGQSAVQFILRDITEQRRLELEMLETAEREQQRIGHDLHDDLGQRISGLEMKSFDLLQALSAKDLNATREQLQSQATDLNARLRESVTLTRSISRGLTSAVLQTEGLRGALEHLSKEIASSGKVGCFLDYDDAALPIDSQTAKHLYHIAQEAAHNALKHAHAKQILLRLTLREDRLLLEVRDDGRGMPKKTKSTEGIGLEVMRHRAHVIGALLTIRSRARHGVSVICSLRIEPTETSADL